MALFLDFDGTLVEIAPHPDAIRVTPDLPRIVEELVQRLEGRLAIVSGRSLADLDRHLGSLGIAMSGSHGGELREPGSADVHALADPLPAAAAVQLRQVAEGLGGLLVETKPCSAAIHFRDRPELEEQVVARVTAVAGEAGLVLRHGKMVVELATPGADKGGAVRHFMAMPPFRGARPLFVGDDLTDEDAFRSVADLAGGGILVGPERETAALWRLPGVAEVQAWLRAAVA